MYLSSQPSLFPCYTAPVQAERKPVHDTTNTHTHSRHTSRKVILLFIQSSGLRPSDKNKIKRAALISEPSTERLFRQCPLLMSPVCSTQLTHTWTALPGPLCPYTPSLTHLSHTCPTPEPLCLDPCAPTRLPKVIPAIPPATHANRLAFT